MSKTYHFATVSIEFLRDSPSEPALLQYQKIVDALLDQKLLPGRKIQNDILDLGPTKTIDYNNPDAAPTYEVITENFCLRIRILLRSQQSLTGLLRVIDLYRAWAHVYLADTFSVLDISQSPKDWPPIP